MPPLQVGAVALYMGRLPGAPSILPLAYALQCVLLLLCLQVRRSMRGWSGLLFLPQK